MLSALLYLRLTSFKNWLITRGRRLRQPKYLLGAIVGGAYFYFFFIRPLGESGARRPPSPASEEARRAMELAAAALPTDWLPVTTALGALALLTFVTFIWIIPAQRAALGFTEAEIAFLFPAPITRRSLVHFRLLSSQFRSLVGAAIMMLFSNRWAFVGGNAFTHAVGWWFIFSTLNLHFSGANFTLTRLIDVGLSAWRRRVLVLLLIVAAFAAALLRMPPTSQPGMMDMNLQPATEWVVALTNTPPLGWLLWPFKWIVGPFLAVDAKHFLLALGPALGVVIVHYLWVVQSAVAFEDSSVEFAQRRGARIAAWRSGRQPPSSTPPKARPGPFRLGTTGRPELAFLWKNLLSTWQYFTLRTFLLCAAILIAGLAWISGQSAGRALLPAFGVLAVFFGAYTIVVGPQFARQDLRSDMSHADVLKTYPLAGWQIVLGELLAPAAILTGILWLTLLTVGITFHPPTASFSWLTPVMRLTTGIALAVIVPPLVLLQLLVPNAAALVFPGWFQLSRTRGGGLEVFGQRMIFFFAQVLTMLFALVPATGMAALLIFILRPWLGPIASVGVSTLAVLVVLIAEVGCGVWWLGRRFEKLDPSTELRS